MEKIPYSNLVHPHAAIAFSNLMQYLQLALVDANAGLVASIHKRATEEVDFIAITQSNMTENDMLDGQFGYGMAGFDGEENVLHPAEEDGTYAYFKGQDVRLIDKTLNEEQQEHFDAEGYEILDMKNLMEIDHKLLQVFDTYRVQNEVISFEVSGSFFKDYLQVLSEVKPLDEWADTGLLHFQPLQFHNPELNEYLCFVQLYRNGEYVAYIPTLKDGKVEHVEYEVDMEKSRKESNEMPEDEHFEYFEEGIPMVGSIIYKQEVNEKNELVTYETVVLKRPHQRGMRVVVQDLGPSGLRLPLLDKHFRPVTVNASDIAHISPRSARTYPFVGKPGKVSNAIPFTIGVDDLQRLALLFDENDIVKIEYLNVVERDDILPVKFEVYDEFKTMGNDNRRHFVRKVAHIAAVLPLVNGKVIVQ